jgi:hypothetical protein
MPEPAFNQKLILISRRPPAELTRGGRKVLHAEKYLAAQGKRAHLLGCPDLERYYTVSWLCLRLWRMEASDGR